MPLNLFLAANKPSEAVMVILADKLQNARAILKDYRDLGDEIWDGFKRGRDGTLWYYRSIIEEYREQYIRANCQNVFKKARDRNPNRWSKPIRNWNPVHQAWLNPEKEDVSIGN